MNKQESQNQMRENIFVAKEDNIQTQPQTLQGELPF